MIRAKPHLYAVHERVSPATGAASVVKALKAPSSDIDTETLRRVTSDISSVLETGLPRAQQVAMLSRMMCEMSVGVYTDALTGLRNRRGFLRDGAQLLGLCASKSSRALVLFMDVDSLKAVNDAGGHAAGDDLLRSAAAALRVTFRSGDIVGRIGGDEFAAVVPAASARAVLGRLRREISRINCSRTRWPVGLSVGVSAFDPGEPGTLIQLLEAADTVMYGNKCARHAG